MNMTNLPRASSRFRRQTARLATLRVLAGWAAGMAYGTVQAYRTPGGGQAHFGTSTAPVLGHLTYIGFAALLVNLVVSAALTVLFRRIGLRDGYDETQPSDYTADPDGSPGVIPPARVLAGLVTREESPR